MGQLIVAENHQGVSPISVAPPLGRRSRQAPLRGRDELIQELIKMLDPANGHRRACVLYGLGGCGKTSVALELAASALERKMQVWWVSGADQTSLVAGMHAVARQLGAQADQLQHGDAADVVWRHLTNCLERWLLVIDNADNLDLLAPSTDQLRDGTGWIRPPTGTHGFVLATTRDGNRQSLGGWCQFRQVNVLSNSDAAEVLLDLASPSAGNIETAAKLAKRIGNLPLALHLAGTYLAATGANPWPDRHAPRSFEDYERAINARTLDIVDDTGQNIARIWHISLDLLTRRGKPQARVLLQLLSSMADSPVPYQLMLDPDLLTSSNLFSDLSGSGLWELIQGLAHLGLVDVTGPINGVDDARKKVSTLSVHPLVRNAAKSYAPPAGRANEYLVTAVALVHRAATDPQLEQTSDPTTWSAWAAITPHAAELARAVTSESDIPHATLHKAYDAAGVAAGYLRDSGMYASAEAEFRELLSHSRKRLGDDYPLTLTIHTRLAFVLHYLHLYEAAEVEHRAVLEIQARTLGNDHPDTLHSRNRAAHMLLHLGQYELAEPEIRSVLERQRDILEPEDEHLLLSREDLANVMGALGRYEQAAEEHRAIVATYSRLHGNTDRKTLNARFHLASVLHDLGSYIEAKSEFLTVLESEVQILGEAHPATFDTREEVAHMRYHLGDPDGARAELRMIRDERRQALGDEHPDVLGSGERSIWLCIEQ